MTQEMVKNMTDAFGAVKGDVLTVLGSSLPAALAIIGLSLSVTIGVKVFKKITASA